MGSICQVEIESLKDQLFEAQEEIKRLKESLTWMGSYMDKLVAEIYKVRGEVEASGVPKK